jgi:hypothetical protein
MHTKPLIMIMHPVGIGATRAMNVLSAKLWVRALVDALPEVSIEASWVSYAEVMVDRERGLQDALVALERCNGAVAVGGEFSRGMSIEWKRAGELDLQRIDLTHPSMPSILTYETFAETRTTKFRTSVIEAFTMKAAA